MSREEAIKELSKLIFELGFEDSVDDKVYALNMAIQALSQEPCEDIAQERYKDLCEYFGGAKDILKSREDFKAWLGRVKWHIHKAEELYEKYEYKKEPCDDVISREDATKHIKDRLYETACNNTTYQCYADEVFAYIAEHRIETWINEIPPVTQKSGKWIPVSERLPEDEQEILFSTKTGRVHSGKYHDDDSANQWYSHRDKCRAWNNVVSAWMPLPKPYEPQESEDKK